MAKKKAKKTPDKPLAVVEHLDCVVGMQKLSYDSIHLVVADPPYNLGRKYHNYDDRRPRGEYLCWATDWLFEVYRVLAKHGSFFLFMHDSLVSEMDVLCKDMGFHKRGQIIWAYTFGVNCARNFTRAHTHILYYTKTKTRYTFNQHDKDLRVPSARQLVYNDKRANPAGRLPDDVWILRADELAAAHGNQGDVWLQSRVCGTFHERVRGMDNQLPIPIVARILQACSNPGEAVLDPFLGTGTTGVAAAMMGRNFFGYDVSGRYCKMAAKRISFAGATVRSGK
jgi:site-specific DNA-methyltransferase (adenine-specific)